MKIYFAGSIRGGRDDQDLYLQIIQYVTNFGQVLTEHIGDASLSAMGEQTKTDEYIFTRDMEWVTEADVIVAEVSTPSLGVGYELGRAEEMGKKILCLYREQEGRRLSAMVSGNKYVDICYYENLDEAKCGIDDFFKSLK